jgi:hypothetical protein
MDNSQKKGASNEVKPKQSLEHPNTKNGLGGLVNPPDPMSDVDNVKHKEMEYLQTIKYLEECNFF